MSSSPDRQGPEPAWFRRDPLTQVFDRGSLERLFAEDRADTRGERAPVALGVFDIDYFKSINDAFGHHRGDVVLRELARLIQGMIRRSDWLFRYGGDEFVLVLPGCGPQHAGALAQRVLDELRATALPGSPPLTISLSMGVASSPNDGGSLHELFLVADHRNYLAKRRGRGRVVGEDHLPEPEGPTYTSGRLIERDDVLDQARAWLDGLLAERSRVLRIEGARGTGRTRMLQEIRQLATMRGLTCLPLHGSAQRRLHAFGALPADAWPERLPLGATVERVVQALCEGAAQRLAAALLLVVDDLPLLDSTSLRLVVELLAGRPDLTVGLVYTCEPEVPPPLRVARHPAEQLALAPLSAAAMHIWLREALRLEPPAPLLRWFTTATRGLAERFGPALDLLRTERLLAPQAGGWGLSDTLGAQLAPLTLPARPQPGRARGLPVGVSELVGREREVDEAFRQLDHYRLLTLIGPGGIGKTRLAIHLAELLVPYFVGGVAFVPLAALSDPDVLLPAICAALGIRDDGSAPLFERLTVTLAGGPTLLVLDNFEQILDAADLLPLLLDAAPGLKLLVTSRERLNLSAEGLYHVPPLGLPPGGSLLEADDLAELPAIALFVARAQAVDMQFALSPENARAVAEICARLDGLPLAIELAAAQCYEQSPQELALALGNRLSALAPGPRDRPSRQRTLRGAIDWGYQLLSAEQQRLFRHLGVTVGGCGPELAAALVSEELAAAAAPLLDALMSKSLLLAVQQAQSGAPARYQMLETIREYALERLGLAGEEAAARRRHLAYVVQFVERAERQLTGTGQQRWLELIEVEHDNIRAALRWALAQREALLAGRIAGAMARFWWMRSYLNEAWRWLSEALALMSAELPAPPDAAARRAFALARIGLGTVLWHQGDSGAARPVLDLGVADARQVGDPDLVGYALNQAGLAYRGEGNFAVAERYFQESQALRAGLGNRRGAAVALGNLGMTIYFQGRAAEAQPYAEQSLLMLRELDDAWGVEMALVDLSEILIARGEYQAAAPVVEEYLAISRTLGDITRVSWGLLGLAEIAFHTGEPARALELLREGVRLAVEVGDKDAHAMALLGLARGALAQGHHRCAARLLGAERRIRAELGVARHFWEERRYLAVLAGLQAALSSAEIAGLWAEAQAAPASGPACSCGA